MEEPATNERLASFVKREPLVSLMFVFSIFLMVFNLSAGAVLARTGNPALLETGLLMTAGFAVIGIAFGLMRSLRSGRVNKTRIA